MFCMCTTEPLRDRTQRQVFRHVSKVPVLGAVTVGNVLSHRVSYALTSSPGLIGKAFRTLCTDGRQLPIVVAGNPPYASGDPKSIDTLTLPRCQALVCRLSTLHRLPSTTFREQQKVLATLHTLVSFCDSRSGNCWSRLDCRRLETLVLFLLDSSLFSIWINRLY